MSLEKFLTNRYDRQRKACDEAYASNDWLPEIEPVKVLEEPRMADYTAIGQQLYRGFAEHHLKAEAPSLPPTIVRHGFTIEARGVGRCVEGYRYFHKANTSATPEPSKESLQTALLNPKTIRFFTFLAQMRLEKNNKYEGALRLLDDQPLREPSFRYDPEEGAFFPDGTIKKAAAENAMQWAKEQDLEETATDKAPHICPAIKYIPSTWEMTVAACGQAGLLDVAEFCRPQVSSLPLDLTKL